jgi:hypothetical protein
MQCNCGGTLKIIKTERLSPRVVRRTRVCDWYGGRVMTHERIHPDANNQFEQRLVDYYRNCDENQRQVMWALMRSFNPERNG